MKKHRWTAQRQQQFLEYLAETGNVSRSIKLVGTSPARVYTLRHNDPAFRQAWDEAEQTAADRLEEEAWRRAVEGFDEPVVSGGKLVRDEDGNAVMVRRYSDVLLIRLLQAHRPHKFDRRRPAAGGTPGGLGADVRAMLLTKLAQLAQHVADQQPPLLEATPDASEPLQPQRAFTIHDATPESVMAGLGPAIHEPKLVDPRAKPGDDDWETSAAFVATDADDA